MAEWKKICAAVDFSAPSRFAMREAADLARRSGAELTLLHVYDAHASSPDVLLSRYEQVVARLEDALHEWQLEAERVAGAPVRSVLLVGRTAPEIVQFLSTGGFDLAVTATHGRTGLKRVLLGSVAEHVVRASPCPVLVVR